jgi:hypothetical protein
VIFLSLDLLNTVFRKKIKWKICSRSADQDHRAVKTLLVRYSFTSEIVFLAPTIKFLQ